MNRSIKSVVFVSVFTSLMAASCYGMDDVEGGLQRPLLGSLVAGYGSTPAASSASSTPEKVGDVRISMGDEASSASSTPEKETELRTPGQESDIENQAVEQGPKNGCCALGAVKNAVKACWHRLPRVGKDAIELGGLAGVDVGASFYHLISANTYFPLLVSYAVGQAASEITDRHKYYVKLLASVGLIGLIELLKLGSGVDLWAFTISALMAVVHATFEEYAKMSGRKNTFSEDFRDLPANLQTMIVARIKGLATQVRAIKNGQHEMPIEVRIADMV